jgi:FKBP-type peptidyl-prolyl cis-trans isomerase (trigger factor)
MTEENIKKLFGEESEVKTEKELFDFIEKNLSQNKRDTELVKTIEGYINNIKDKGFEVTIPKTLIDEEQKTRIKSMEQRFGGKDKLEAYFKNLGEEKGQIFLDDIRKSAQESLEKFFILQKAIELLEVNVDRKSQEQLHVEKKLYEKLTGKFYDETEEKKEKKPAKKEK